MKIKRKLYVFERCVISKEEAGQLDSINAKECDGKKREREGERNKRFCTSDRNRHSPVVILRCLEKSFLLLPLSFRTIRLL